MTLMGGFCTVRLMRALRRASVLAALLVSALVSPGLAPAALANHGGSNVVLKPADGVTRRNKLVLFIPGTNLTPQQSMDFLNHAANAGFHVIGISYTNKKSVAKICKKDGDACFGQVRREIVFGTDSSPRVDVSVDKSILGLLKAEVLRQSDTAPDADGWDQYRSGDFLILNNIIATGHSQGAGHAAIIGIDRTIWRVGLLAGPNDVVRGTGAVPSWTRGPRTTPSSVWRAMTNQDDDSRPDQEDSWDNFGIGSSSPARQIVSGGGDPHLSVVIDGQLASGIQTRWTTLLGA